MCRKTITSENQKGAVLIITALIISAIVIIVALVIDGINAAATRKQLVVISEQAAVAFMEELMQQTSLINFQTQTPPSYQSLVAQARERAAAVAKENAILGSVDGFETGAKYDDGGHLTLGAVQVGRWIPEDSPDACPAGKSKPCFLVLDESTLDAAENRVNAVRVTTRSPGSIRYFLANFFNAASIELSGTATAWVPPTDFEVLIDLSPSIVRDTHMMRNPNKPGICSSQGLTGTALQNCINNTCYNPTPATPLTNDNICLVRGTQAEFAFSNSRVTANNPSSVLLNDLTNCYAGLTLIPNFLDFTPPSPQQLVQTCLDRNEAPPTGPSNCLPGSLLPIDSVQAFERASLVVSTGGALCEFLQTVANGVINGLIASLGPPTGSEPPFTLMAWSREICGMAKCDWLGLPASRGTTPLTNPTQHFKSDYLNVNVRDPELGAGNNRTFAVDLAGETGGNIRGAEPLFSILNGVNYLASALDYRRKGDGLGMIGFDWNTPYFDPASGEVVNSVTLGAIPNGQSNGSRYRRLRRTSSSYQAIQNLTNINITTASVRPTSPNIPRPWTGTNLASGTRALSTPPFLRNLWFPRGVKPWNVGPDLSTNDIWPLIDLADVTDLRTPLIAAHQELTTKNSSARVSRKAVILFTDGIHNCIDGTPNNVLTNPNCTNLRLAYNALSSELLNDSNRAVRPSPLPLYERDNIAIHVIPFGSTTAPHTLNFSKDNDSNNCLTDKVARQSNLPYVRDTCDPEIDNRIMSNIVNNWGPDFENWVNWVSQFGLDSAPEEVFCQSRQYALANVAGVGENFYETNTFLYEMAKRTNGLWAPLRPNLAERNPLPTLPGGQPLPAGDTWGQHFALSDVGDEDGDGNFNELLERECTDSSVSPPVPFQRQIFDRWDRPKRQQVIEAIRTILAQSPVILVEELN